MLELGIPFLATLFESAKDCTQVPHVDTVKVESAG